MVSDAQPNPVKRRAGCLVTVLGIVDMQAHTVYHTPKHVPRECRSFSIKFSKDALDESFCVRKTEYVGEMWNQHFTQHYIMLYVRIICFFLSPK